MKKTIIYILNIIALVFFGLHSPKIMAEFAEHEPPDSTKDSLTVEIMPEIIKSATPVYPAEAKKAGVECTLQIKALVSISGKVKQATVEKCSNPDIGFEESAIKAALATKYKPALKDGKPIKAWVTYKVVFSLSDKP